jgi:hypothetical protein
MDIQKIKDRLNQLQQTTTTSNSFWKPQPGKTQIRIVPYKFNKDNPFIELYFHYSMGDNKTHISPISFGRPDPINEFASKLKSTGDRDEWIQGRKLEPKMRTFAPVVERGQEHEGIKFWGFGKTVYQELLGFIADPDYGDITDPITGRDIVVERQTPAEAGNQYGKTAIRVKPNQLPLTEDKDVLTKMFDSQVDIKEIYAEPTYEELKELLKNYLNPDNNEESSESSQTSTSTTKTNTSAVSDVEDAFDQLFNS